MIKISRYALTPTHGCYRLTRHLPPVEYAAPKSVISTISPADSVISMVSMGTEPAARRLLNINLAFLGVISTMYLAGFLLKRPPYMGTYLGNVSTQKINYYDSRELDVYVGGIGGGFVYNGRFYGVRTVSVNRRPGRPCPTGRPSLASRFHRA